MTPSSWHRVKEIFANASEQPEAVRAEFVRRATEGDSAVRDEVLRLLSLDAGAEELLEDLKPPREMIQSAAELRVFYGGEVLADRYEIRRFIASGGMGEVYEAEDRELGRRIAIKAIRGELVNEDRLLWMKREVQAARRIEHPNVCRVFDLVRTQGATGVPIVFLTMELLEGETLSQKLHRDGPMSERQALPLLRQMVAALSAAHRAGVIHRDFKCANMMLVPRTGGSPRVVVTDFGLARQVTTDRRATVTSWSPGSMAGYGTPAYMSPEQIQGGKVGPAADIYALGVVLYEMLTGELPYPEDSPLAMAVKKTREKPFAPENLAPTLRPTWSAAMLQCLEADPKRRFVDVREILVHLETRSSGMLWWRLLWRRHGFKLQLAAAAIALGVLSGIAFWLWPPEPRAEAVADWQRGVYDLQAGEPAQAARRLELALSQHRLPVVAHAYLALAWHDLGFPVKARAELRRALYTPLQPDSDKLFEKAVVLQLDGHGEQALPLLSKRPADLALLEDQLGKSDADALWKQVAVKSPNQPAAHLRLAMAYAKKARWKEAEREFILAETYFQAGGDTEMVRAVSARRGFARFQNGDTDLARYDLPSLAGFMPRLGGAGFGPCERTVTLMAGEADNFALPFDPVPYVNPDFKAEPIWPRDSRLKQFDELRDDQNLFVSLILPPFHFCAAQVETRVRKGVAGFENDTVMIGVPGTKQRSTYPLWLDTPNATERLFTFELSAEFLLDVQRSQLNKKVTSLDFVIGDDTIVDYIKVVLVY